MRDMRRVLGPARLARVVAMTMGAGLLAAACTSSNSGGNGLGVAPTATTAVAGVGGALDRHSPAAPAPHVTGPVAGKSGLASPVDLASKGYVEDGRVTRIYAIRNPHKLAGLDVVAALTRT